MCQAHVLEVFTYLQFKKRARGNEFGKVVWGVITEDLAKQNAGSKKKSRISQRSPVQPTAPPPLSRPSAPSCEAALLERTGDLEVTGGSSSF